MSPFWFGGELNGKQANCDGNLPYETGKGPYLERPSVMGSYGANPFGLCDQHGQVWESCQDCFGPEQDWYEDEDNVCASWPADPTGASSGSSAFCGAARGATMLSAVVLRTVTATRRLAFTTP